MQSLGLRAWRIAVAAILLLSPAFATAQVPQGAPAAGRVVGKVTDANGRPVANAQVSIDGGRLGGSTNANGEFAISGVPSGTHAVSVKLLGYRAASQSGVSVVAGQDASVAVKLEHAALNLAGVVVSASRQAERITDAPATITRIDADQIANTVGNSFGGALKQVAGVDFIQVGVTAVAINARGFNSSFNNRMLMMEDGRIAVLPENGLPVGQFTTINKLDLAGVEVLVGPGAALYGADASNGVLTLQTKDPKLFPGTDVEVAGGTRGYVDAQFRQAAVSSSGTWGYKLTGEWQQANDFENTVRYAQVAGRPDSTPEIGIDWKSSVGRAGGALVRYMGDSRLELIGGMSISSGVGQTNVGRNQLKNWLYNNAQLRFTSPRWYANAYRTQSMAGDSYAINRYSQNRLLVASSISDDSVKKLSDWPSNGQLYAAELQNNFSLPTPEALATKIIWGGQYRTDLVSSKREWLDDRETGKDLSLRQYGVYAQTETRLTSLFRLVLAGRYDKHQDYDAQWSPKAGILFKPTDDQTLRVTYNKAFKSPTTLQNHFNIVDFSRVATAGVAVYGNQKGFEIQNGAGAVIGTITPLVPEENQTWELGYKGVLGDNLFVDGAVYDAHYDHFLTPLITIANPFANSFAYRDGQRIVNPAGDQQIVLTYRNLGKAHIHGFDGAFKYLATPRVSVSGTVGLVKLNKLELENTFTLSAGQRRELSSLNAPSARWTLGMDFADVWSSMSSGFVVRHSGDYLFASGINVGYIPTFTTLDLSFNYKLPARGTQLNLAVNNLFSCSARVASPVANQYSRFTSCGFDKRHIEMYNMPRIGTMVFLGLRYSR